MELGDRHIKALKAALRSGRVSEQTYSPATLKRLADEGYLELIPPRRGRKWNHYRPTERGWKYSELPNT